ncbi:hypothetical protein RRG08_006338 [Elysia crispata]|uniref:Uncharacterized protein n=1 Tax=Elysia crispata TaxID=231223 RepID=A0AAE1D2N6_9GAST|nr:hypothetical protein RRG08_006338 [Elysia crispata]
METALAEVFALPMLALVIEEAAEVLDPELDLVITHDYTWWTGIYSVRTGDQHRNMDEHITRNRVGHGSNRLCSQIKRRQGTGTSIGLCK